MKLTQQDSLDHLIRLNVSGSVDFHHLSPLDEPICEVLGENAYAKTVIMNMGGVETLDSSGVGWLLTCQKNFRSSGGSLVLHSLSPTARNVLRVLNLQRVLRMADNERHAVDLTEAGENSVGE